MSSDGDSEALAQLEAKLRPERIRATLSFAGLYQMTHELIKQSILDQVRSFYLIGFDETGYLYDEEAYQFQVKSLHEKRFRASLLWLVNRGAITLVQADRLHEIQEHRNELTHELAKYVIDVKFEPKFDLFVDALSILKDVSRFWTQLEIEIGTFEEHGEISVDDAVPVSLYVLQLCIDAYGKGLTDLDVGGPTDSDSSKGS
ncbi:hypothetical protein [Pseudonocardia sp.]|uniref:hypothetical protein n=1 Tax=Pseudonocardia sp. TaxID=60912 RepID=UPI00260B327A|nr:hypothetical protein [Pseudonocardia sp.]